MPHEWKTPEVHKKSAKYVLPLFRQTWGVFAPVPREEGRLYYKYYANNEWSEEFSFKDEMAKKGHLGRTRIADMLCFYLVPETRSYAKEVNGKMDYSEVKTSSNYGWVLYSVYAHVKYKQLNETPDSIALILERDLFPKKGYSKKKTIRDYFKPDSF